MAKPKYPHMRQWEQEIMDKFHNKIEFEATWTYDVALKVRETPLPKYITQNEKQLWARLTSKRVDAVGETQDQIFVCEVKDRLRPSALGQALTYKTLYEEQFKPEKPVTPAIITEYDDADMRHVCEVYGVRIFMV